jgi:methyl-accepting chemotaxis protein
LSRVARQSAAEGSDRIHEMRSTLDTIKTAVGEMESAVGEMHASSQEIAKIIRTIDEIAFQTNLLALNAAVEAARAGEAGLGFAVVADEVRALAQRSAQAARDTSEKIAAAVQRSELGHQASRKVAGSLGEVQTSARQIAESFDHITTQIKTLDETIVGIAAASKEQSQGVTEINSAIGDMDKVTQANAATAEENASAAEELRSQVAHLQTIVDQLQAVVTGAAITTATPHPGPTAGALTPGRKPDHPAASPPARAPKPVAGRDRLDHAPMDAFPMPAPLESGNPVARFQND